MNKSIVVSILIVIFCSLVFGQTKQVNIPTKEQVQKLADAAWKEPIENIDILYYEYFTGIPEPIEQIRKRAEKVADSEFQGRPIDKLEPYEKERRNKNIEGNVKNWIKDQIFPRKIKEHVWISGDQQRIESVKVGPDEPMDEDTPFVHTYINAKDANTGEIVSYHYASDINTVFVNPKKWKKKTIGQFVGIPLAGALQTFLGVDQGSTPTSPNYIPSPNKIAELARTGLAVMESIGGVKMENSGVNRISVYPAPDSLNSRDIIEMGDPNYFPAAVLICDRNDYSRVYRAEFRIPTTNQLIYIRECKDFDSDGFPHNVTETWYDIKGNFEKKSVYNIIKVRLNHSIPSEMFEIHPPRGYKTVDQRSRK